MPEREGGTLADVPRVSLSETPGENQTRIEDAEPLRLRSVTTTLKMGIGDGEGLIRWRHRVIATAAVDKRDSLEWRVRDDGRDETIDWLCGLPYRRSEKAKLRGSSVHAIAEKLALGIDPGPIDEEYRPYAEQLARWLRKWQPRYLMAEAPVYNLSYGYAGTLDGVMEVGGRTVVFDYKTTEVGPSDGKARPPWPEVALQLCAYRNAQLVGLISEQRYDDRSNRYYLYDQTAHHEPMPPTNGALCIVISPYDCFAHAIATGPKVWEAWQHVSALADWSQEGVKSVIGARLDAEEPES
jgi:hypothetical protein